MTTDKGEACGHLPDVDAPRLGVSATGEIRPANAAAEHVLSQAGVIPGSGQLRPAFRRADGSLAVFDVQPAPDPAGEAGEPMLIVQPSESVALAPGPCALDPHQHSEILHKAAECAGFGQWYFHLSDRRMWASESYLAMLGYGPGEVEIDSAWMRARIHPGDLPAAVASMEALIAGDSAMFRADYRLRCKDGSYKWFEATGRKIACTGNASDTIICGSLKDIGARKKDEARLEHAVTEAERNAELLHIATEHGGVVPWYLDPATGGIVWNSKFQLLTGFAEGVIENRLESVLSFIHPDDVAGLRDMLHQLLSGSAEVLRLDHRIRHKDGHWVWCSTVARVVSCSGEGVPPLVCGSTIDISDHKRQEAALGRAVKEAQSARCEAEAARIKAQEYAELLSVASEHGHVVPWYRIPETKTSWFGSNMAKMLGFPPDVRLDTPTILALIHPEDVPAVQADHRAIERGERDGYARDYRLRRSDGSWCWVSSRGRRVDRDAEDLPYLFCGSLTDITERKQTEERLARALAEAEAAHAAAKSSEELLRLAAACGEVGAWHICTERGEAWMLDEAFRQLGFAPGEFVPDHAGLRALIHPDDLPAAKRSMDDLINDRAEVYDNEQRLRHKDGTYHWYRTVARKIDRSDRGLPPVIAGARTRIDHHKQNERRLAETAEAARRASERLNTLADNAPGALFEYLEAADGTISLPYFSAKLPEIMGVTAAEIAQDARSLATNVHPADRAVVRESLAAARRDLSPVGFRYRLIHPQSGERWILASLNPTAQQDGAVLWHCSIADITDQLAAERRAGEAAAALRRAHERLHTLTDNAPGALFECRMEPDGRFRFPYINAKMPEIMGVTASALRADGTAMFRNIPPEDRETLTEAMQTSRQEMSQVAVKLKLEHPRTGPRWLLISASPVAGAAGSVTWYGNIVDITDRLAAETRATEAADEMRRAHERLSSVANIAPVGLYEFRRFPDGTGDFPYTSKRFEDLLGFTRAEIEDKKDRIFGRIDPEDMPAVRASGEESARTLGPWNMRFRVRHPLRGTVWLSGPAIPRREADGIIVWTGALHDVTADVRREAELKRAHQLAEQMRAENERQALHDGLTGLPNRRYYDQMLSQRLSQARRGGPKECALIRVDLDHFKYVNDTLGHEAGDRVLARVGDVLRRSIRAADFAARIGGDEFAILLGPGMSRDDAREVVERIQARLAEPLNYEGRHCRFGASFGIAHTDDITEVGAELHLFADAALYQAKDAGRNRMEFFTTDLHRNILNDRRIASELQEALEQDQFVPFFQPQVSALDGGLVGIEALLRWRHPEQGLLSPYSFMHVAEQLGIVPEIDRLMMEKSREALKRLRHKGVYVPRISFNVSSGRMHDPDVVSLARDMVQEDTNVTFELLESILVEEESDAFRFHLDLIREAGIDIEIDDFGSGHASIIGLMEIAPSALKIDRRIVAPVASDLRSRNLVRAIVEIAETLGIRTVAEGVETAAQADVLRAIGCDVLQGYLFSMPVSEDDFLTYASNLPRQTA